MDSFSITSSDENRDWGKTFSRFVAGLSVIAGILFLLSAASDIQLGFGMVLLAIGLINVSR